MNSGVLVHPLRLCPSASIPSDVVSRCTGPDQGHAHPAPPTPCRAATECKDTPEVDQKCKACRRPDPGTRGRLAATCQRANTASGGAIYRSRACADAQAGQNGNRKGPGSFRNPGPCEQSLEGAPLGASLSRMHSILVPSKRIAACREGPVHGNAAHAQRTHRCSTCERDQTLHGSGGSDSVA